MKTKAIYAGSFDPFTFGHLYILDRAAKIFDEVIVGIAVNPAKKALIYPDIRAQLIQELIIGNKTLENKISVKVFGNRLLMHEAIDLQCTHLVRGIRNIGDFEDEWKLYSINDDIGQRYIRDDWEDDRIVPQTIFIPPTLDYCNISSSMVKSLIGFQGWERLIEIYLPNNIADYVITHCA
jgi:pantetheine-phosphate adenylyltransferase